MHWEGKALRMLPEDFELRSKYGHGLDWPINYQDLEPFYRKAEYEMGVRGRGRAKGFGRTIAARLRFSDEKNSALVSRRASSTKN
jgi:choline dehydrogenase-like flavoprotein